MKSILIVDHEHSVRNALAELFDTEENEITSAGTLEGALQALSRGSYDLIVTDLRLGVRASGGLQVMAAAGVLSPSATVIVQSAESDHSTREASLRLGATYFLRKPADLAAVASLAARHDVASVHSPASESSGR
jgi:DNA-binding NtrC family response regulator